MSNNKQEEDQFTGDMLDIYYRAVAECRYKPTAFLAMVRERGGLSTAKALLAGRPSDGFLKLLELRRLDLTVEHLVLDDRWSDRFTPQELTTAKARLGRNVRG